MIAYPNLLSPVRCGPIELNGRIVSTSHQTGLVEDHLPTDDLVAYHEARAAGGAAAIFLEATAVHPTGLLTSHTLGGYLDAIAGGYERLARAVQPHGARLLVQLFHGGRESSPGRRARRRSRPRRCRARACRSEPRALTRPRSTIWWRASRCRRPAPATAGSTASRSRWRTATCVAQFFNPLAQPPRRRLRRRARGAAALRAGGAARDPGRGRRATSPSASACPANDLAPGGHGRGRPAPRSRRPCGRPASSTSCRWRWALRVLPGSTQIVPPPPVALNAIADRTSRRPRGRRPDDRHDPDRGPRARRAAGRRRPRGPRRHDPRADRRPGPAAQGPRPGAGRSSSASAATRRASATTTRASRSGASSTRAPAASGALAPVRRGARRVLVVGAGPAGRGGGGRGGPQRRRRDADRARGGHRRPAPAGRPGARPPRDVGALAATRPARARRGGRRAAPRVRGRRRDRGRGFEHVVLATGARPFVPPLPARRSVTAWEAIAQPQSVRGPALVADWGGDWAGLDAAEVLAEAGVEVTLACAATVPGEALHQYHRNLYLARLDGAGVRIRHHLELAGLDGAPWLRHVFSGRREELGPVETLVLSLGRRPQDDLWGILERRPGAIRAGDVLGSANARGGDPRGLHGRPRRRMGRSLPSRRRRRPVKCTHPAGRSRPATPVPAFVVVALAPPAFRCTQPSREGTDGNRNR